MLKFSAVMKRVFRWFQVVAASDDTGVLDDCVVCYADFYLLLLLVTIGVLGKPCCKKSAVYFNIVQKACEHNFRLGTIL